MNIGIDIDGVIVDILTPAVDYGTKYFVEENLPIKIDAEKYSILECSAEQEEKFWQRYFIKYITESNITKDWLEKNNIKYDEIIFTDDEEKVNECIKNNINVMIEDSPTNIESVATQIPVIKYECPYNKKINGKNIITAYSWYHIYDIISKIK